MAFGPKSTAQAKPSRVDTSFASSEKVVGKRQGGGGGYRLQ
jgi:hypothetical protein